MEQNEARRRFEEAEALAAGGALDAAVTRYDAAIALDPALAGAHLRRANVLASLGRLLEALAGYDRFVAQVGDFAPAHSNRGHVLERLGRPDEALASLDVAILLKPDYAEAHNNRGNALRSLGRPREALESYDRALALKPDFAQALSNRGNALCDFGRRQAALAAYDAAIARAPAFADAHRNRGTTLYRLARPREAIESYARAVAIDPQDVEARYEMAQAALLLGDFDTGWRLYESRKQANPERYPWLGRFRDFAGAEENRAIAVVSEQGFGDTVQFSRYIDVLARRCEQVVFCVQPELRRLLADNLPRAAVVDHIDHVAPSAACAALMSLPLALGLGAAPFVSGQAYLRADSGLARAWEARLPERRRLRIGIAWAGDRRHPDDRNRSIELARLSRLFAHDADWICLQKDLREGDAERLEAAGIAFHGDRLTDFSETAALVDRLDLVITVDTAIAHLAGAMGKVVWVLLPFSPDWRWLLDRADSPWYASARLFRQAAVGDWANVVAAVGRELAAQFGRETDPHFDMLR